jgi:hypothetical protein
MMTRIAAITIALVAAAVVPPAAAQESNLAPTVEANALAPAGWSVTPSLAYSGAYDDNVLIRSKNDVTPADFLNVVNPRATVDFNGRHTQLSGSYDGAFLLYRDLGSLNSYDQHGWIFARRMLSKHVAIFARNTAASVPTTELSQFIGVPFVRTGSRLDSLRSGVEIAFTKRTSLAASYDFDWIDFDDTQPGAGGLYGGHSHGASANLRHQLDARLTLTADYSVQHAAVGTINETFGVWNTGVGVEYKVSDVMNVRASGGIAHVGGTETQAATTGPAGRLGLSRHFRTFDVDLGYSRSFAPSYSFGGTMDNQDVSARVRVPIARRFYTTGGVSWRSNEPLNLAEPPFQSLWIETTLGYAMTLWARLEGFYASSHQEINRPGGLIDRNRYGFQVVTAKPVRIH